jgi:hypothetical protein
MPIVGGVVVEASVGWRWCSIIRGLARLLVVARLVLIRSLRRGLLDIGRRVGDRLAVRGGGGAIVGFRVGRVGAGRPYGPVVRGVGFAAGAALRGRELGVLTLH